MSDIGKDRTVADSVRIVNVTLSTSFVGIQALLNGGLGANNRSNRILQLVLICGTAFKICDGVNSSGTHFRTVAADTEKVIPCGDISTMTVAASSGTPTLTIEVYYA